MSRLEQERYRPIANSSVNQAPARRPGAARRQPLLARLKFGTWLLLALALVLFTQQISANYDELAGILPGLAAAATIVFVAVIFQLYEANRRLTAGALLLAVEPIIMLAVLLAWGTWNVVGDWGDAVFFAARLAVGLAWVFTLAGMVVIGLALGGVHTRRGWAMVGLGALLAAIDIIQYLLLIANGSAAGVSPEDLVLGLLRQSVLLAEGYLLGAAVERGFRLFALGAALQLVQFGLFVALNAFLPATPQAQPGTGLFWLVDLLGLAAAIALIVGAIRELPALGKELPAAATA